jgi:hypothetical protein
MESKQFAVTTGWITLYYMCAFSSFLLKIIGSFLVSAIGDKLFALRHIDTLTPVGKKDKL